jgi:hypothetical protein
VLLPGRQGSCRQRKQLGDPNIGPTWQPGHCNLIACKYLSRDAVQPVCGRAKGRDAGLRRRDETRWVGDVAEPCLRSDVARLGCPCRVYFVLRRSPDPTVPMSFFIDKTGRFIDLDHRLPWLDRKSFIFGLGENCDVLPRLPLSEVLNFIRQKDRHRDSITH